MVIASILLSPYNCFLIMRYVSNSKGVDSFPDEKQAQISNNKYT